MKYVIQRTTGQWKDEYVTEITFEDAVDGRLCNAKVFNSRKYAQSVCTGYSRFLTQHKVTPVTEQELFKARLGNT